MKAIGIGLMAVALAGTGWAETLTVVDQAGRTVEIREAPTRVASAFGVATAYVYALGAGDLLVGARYLGIPDSPLASRVMRRIDPRWEGKAFPGDVNVETVAALGAELVLVGLRHRALAELLDGVGIPAVTYGSETFDAVREATHLTGRILGRDQEARRLISFFDEVLAEARRVAQAEAPLPRVLFVGTERLRVAGAGMYQAQLVALAGGELAAGDLGGASWQNVSPEQILLWDPDVIVIAPYGPVTPGAYLDDPVFQGVGAVKAGRVHKMPQLLFAWDTPIPESVLGVLWLAELLHPGRAAALLEGFVVRFYAEFYGTDLTVEEMRGIIGP